MTTLRPDLQVIADLVPPGCSVLDVGCNDGHLLAWLSEHKQVKGRGIELNQQQVSECLAKGLAVIQGNADTDLTTYPDGIVDTVILSQTLQALANPREVLEQLVRIGKQAIVSVPNFGHWKNRFYLALQGRMPVTRTLAYEWYDTPNIHFCTIRDFMVLCEEADFTIQQQLYTCTTCQKPAPIRRSGQIANLIGEQGIFVIGKALRH